MSPLGPPAAAPVADDDDEEESPACRAASDDEDGAPSDLEDKRDEEDDVEVDVCSNPDSPVDLSRSQPGSFVHPLARHAFTCLANGLPGTIVPGTGLVGATYHLGAPPPLAPMLPGKSSGGESPRVLAFSVENILDPNKFNGGRVARHPRVRARRIRSSSVREGSSCPFFAVLEINAL